MARFFPKSVPPLCLLLVSISLVSLVSLGGCARESTQRPDEPSPAALPQGSPAPTPTSDVSPPPMTSSPDLSTDPGTSEAPETPETPPQ